LRLEFAGADIRGDPADNVFFLEANFPCYYPHPQLHGGVSFIDDFVNVRDCASVLAKAARIEAEPARNVSIPALRRRRKPSGARRRV